MNSRAIRRTLVAIACGIIGLARPSRSDAQTATITIRLPVKDVMFLSASSTSVVLPTPNAAAYDGTTLPVATGPTLTVQSNKAWKVTISSAANFTFANAGGNTFTAPVKPATNVSWGVSNFAASGTLGVAGGNVPFTAGASGTAASYAPTASATTPLFFQSTWLYTRDVPGSYTLTVNLTLSTP